MELSEAVCGAKLFSFHEALQYAGFGSIKHGKGTRVQCKKHRKYVYLIMYKERCFSGIECPECETIIESVYNFINWSKVNYPKDEKIWVISTGGKVVKNASV